MRFLVDTNVFLDFFLSRDDDGKDAKTFFTKCFYKRNEIYITSLSLRDIGYISHKILHSDEASRFIQLKAYEFSTKVIGISADSAITSLYKNNKDYEDSLQIEAAKEAMADAIITNDKTGFKESLIPVYTTKQIIELI